MATFKVTGKTKEELRELRSEFYSSKKALHYEMDDWYCLAKIPRQPEDYDGPPRYCVSTALTDLGRCKFHGGKTELHPENLERYANLKHSMNALRSTIINTMDEGEKVLYDAITKTWPEVYDIDPDEDPNAAYNFHVLAIEIIRNERAAGWILDHGEDGTKRVFSPTGEEYEESVPHYLAEALSRNRGVVMRLEDNLGISRKARLKQEDDADASDLVKSFAEVGKTLLSDGEYDPDAFEPDLDEPTESDEAAEDGPGAAPPDDETDTP
jgi:hypothetical protein